jgi:hypothetical protein
LTARPSGLPQIALHPDSPDDLPLAPPDSLETTAADAALSALNAAARGRLDEVETVGSAVRAIEPAERSVREAERTAGEAQSANDAARNALSDARAAFQLAVEGWQAAAAKWIERSQQHHAAHDLGAIETPAELGSSVAALVDEIVRGEKISARFEASIAPAIRHYEGLRAQREALLERQRELVTELEERAAELAAKQFPDPPMLGWQQRQGRCFAELIDFTGHVDAAARASLEAALEASGLLAAEVICSDSSLRLADGQLIVVPRAIEASEAALRTFQSATIACRSVFFA